MSGKTLNEIKNIDGWSVFLGASGDLNNDKIDDYVAILQSHDSIREVRCNGCKRLPNKGRIIAVLISNHGQPKVSIQNNRFIARPDEGGMVPFLAPEIQIIDGQLSISYQYTRSNTAYFFEFSNNDLLLVSAISGGVHSASGNVEFDFYDFKSRVIRNEKGHISKDSTEVNFIDIDHLKKLKSLSELEEMYNWQITAYRFL
ncbi:hypothetical protein OZ410_09215 [Robiginitalea sp. M366]|uniref:hypothetical protein n=1 Tax=Robiginitalea aestuariiviva TaxID=3036903 RepID=UPI00240D2A85|nr:hypothetical protein [Robiginitalea aestuariiviva]MDG1572494.1 hypothetical protein [Robiginitalea aestuariiviva]